MINIEKVKALTLSSTGVADVVLAPDVVLELIERVGRISARLCMCRDCGGQGEVYSGHSTYQGHWQPPEPDMNICPTCGGDGVLGPIEDFESLAAERDKLKAENEALQSQLRAFTGSAYPVSININERGYNWSEAWLDEALAVTKEQQP